MVDFSRQQETIKRRLKARFSQLPKGISLADELIADRREEAKQDIADGKPLV
jgi:hypothetical protein